ncbi:uncharacterized protein LOC132734254 [Ruditapes philippinarum]|uniref:uncharacterized protein LOC132734254 n=1 Tax=Ruditapes philippinarum TaxID=129788 RepID=UPI00295B1B1C|nr:uncharacterized protein LOC132734254 [Ruditapes philippinarum]XP_060576941.1 uncharacterized protein LOC132734254 [Ruditapes philippinarum]
MHVESTRDRWGGSPRTLTPGRPKSVRELYRPAVQDLSEQAARNGTSNQEEAILSVVSTCTPRGSRSSADYYSEKFHSPTPLISQFTPEEAIKSSPTTSYCFNTHNNEYHEDLHRQRVLVSAHQRRKLQSRLRRSKSTPLSDRSREYWHDDYKNKLELVITNNSKVDEKDLKERINYRLTNRTKPRTAPQGSLMSNGSPLSVTNGYTQTLTQHYPKYTQKYSNWLTNGFKVQSFRTHPLSQEYSHSRPPPPLLQYINRPKTVHSRLGPRKFYGSMDINIIGTQKKGV